MDRQTLTGLLELFSSQIWMSVGGAAAHTIGKLLRYGHRGLVVAGTGFEPSARGL